MCMPSGHLALDCGPRKHGIQCREHTPLATGYETKNPDNVRAILDISLTSMLLSWIFMDSQGWVTIQLFSASTTFASNSDFIKRHKRKDQAAEAITTKHILADGLMATSRNHGFPGKSGSLLSVRSTVPVHWSIAASISSGGRSTKWLTTIYLYPHLNLMKEQHLNRTMFPANKEGQVLAKRGLHPSGSCSNT